MKNNITKLSGHAYTERQTGDNCSAYALQNVLRYYGLSIDAERFYNRCVRAESPELPLNGGVTPQTVCDQFRKLAEEERKAERKFIISHPMRNCMGGNLNSLRYILKNDNPVIVVGFADVRDERTADNLHYMVVTGIDDENVYLLDSSGGTEYGEQIEFCNRIVSREDFLKMWKISDCDCGGVTLGEIAKEMGLKVVNNQYIYFETK